MIIGANWKKEGVVEFIEVDFEPRNLCLSIGSNKEDEADHISLSLSLADTDKLPSAWEVLANFKFFLFNQITNEYISVQDVDAKVWRFHCLKTKWGYDQILPLSTFSDPTNGYLVDDCCAFGAEIFVIKPNNATYEFINLSTALQTLQCPIYTWKIKNFSESKTTTKLSSPEFIMGGWNWKLDLYPNGNGSHTGKSLSLFLSLTDFLGDSELEVKYKLRLIDQVSRGSKERVGTAKFSSSGSPVRSTLGFADFLSLKDFNSATKNYLVDSTLLIEVEICGLSRVKAIKVSDVPVDLA